MGLTRDQRSSLLDLINPGESTVTAGIIMTYSADASAIFALLSTLAGHPLSNEPSTSQEPSAFQILRDIELLKDRVRILNHVGGFKTTAATEKYSALLDNIIDEVNPHKNAMPDPYCSFHPKFFLLEYQNKDNPNLSNILLALTTRNLTSDDSLDAISCFSIEIGKKETPNGLRLAKFIKAALAAATMKTPNHLQALLSKINRATLIPKVNKNLEMSDIEFYGQVPGATKMIDLVPHDSERNETIIISPFIDRTTLDSLKGNADKKGTNFLFSEIQDFKKICQTIEGVNFLNDNFSCYELDRSGEKTFRSLHAKMLVERKNEKTFVTVGSANATKRAWQGANWECVVRFSTSTNFFDDLRDDLFFSDQKKRTGAICTQFTPQLFEAPEDDSESRWHEAVVRGELIATPEREKDSDKITIKIQLRPYQTDIQVIFEAVRIKFLNEVQFHNATLIDGSWKCEWSVSAKNFSAFVSMQCDVSLSDNHKTVAVIRRIPVEQDLLELRNKSFKTDLIQTHGVHDILSAILEDSGFGGIQAFEPGSGAWSNSRTTGSTLVCLESLCFLFLKDDPESIAKKQLIHDVMTTDFDTKNSSIDAETFNRNKTFFEKIKLLWKTLNNEFNTPKEKNGKA